jgi:antitoxin (DNA-binding transcriptional repressor) of toxin-antitoxin stability system
MITANMHEAKSRLSALVKAVEEDGETVILCRNGKEVAEIRRRPKQKPFRRNLTPDPSLRVILAPGYNPTEALTEEEWPSACR